jgi:hypothetical protein
VKRQLRKAIKTKGSFPNEDAARKLVYLALQNATRNGRRPGTGRRRCWRSKSASVTETLQTDRSWGAGGESVAQRSLEVTGSCREVARILEGTWTE